MDLIGKTAVVTGAGRGIGTGIATVLAKHGADLVLTDRDTAGAEETAAELRKTGRKVLVLQHDVTSWDSSQSIAERAIAEYGKIDILADFVRSDPGFEIELVPIPASHKLWRRDVDIAISLDRPERGRIVMRKLIDYDLRLYASRSYFGTGPLPASRKDLNRYPFVGYIEELLYTEELDFIRAISAGLRIVFRAATVHAQLDAVCRGVGLGVLPCFMARGAGVIPVLENEIAFRRTYWMLYSEDYRSQDRIRRVTDFIHDQTAQMAGRFHFQPEQTTTPPSTR